jgi:broad specificity phosphatase PhoE
MSRLLLVRHAQASFHSENYDLLSARGERQARVLGEYWAHRKIHFDRVVCGPAVRHRRTAALAAEASRSAGLIFPTPVVLDEFDEFRGEAVLAQCLPQLSAKNRRFREMSDALQSSATEPEKHASFQRLFQAVITLWVDEKIVAPGVESWREFAARVHRGLTSFLAHSSKGELSVIFTSGGPIAIAVQRALHLSAQDTLQIAWMARNCSLTEFLFSGDRFTLSTFNAFPHLDDEALLTYR